LVVFHHQARDALHQAESDAVVIAGKGGVLRRILRDSRFNVVDCETQRRREDATALDG